MANVTDLANAAAAVAAGYIKTQIDYTATGVGIQPRDRFWTRFEKPVTGAPGDSGSVMYFEGSSTASAAAADTQALASLNAWRRHRYGGSAGRATAQPQSDTARGGVHVIDLT